MIEHLESDNDVLGFFLPADKLAGALEREMNAYVLAQGREIQDLTLAADVITFVRVGT